MSAPKRNRDSTPGLREDTRRALGQTGNVLPPKTPAVVGRGKAKNPVTVAQLTDPAAAKAAVRPRAKRPFLLPDALATATVREAPTDIRHNELLDDVFGDAPAVHPVAAHLSDPHSRLGAQLRFLRQGVAGVKGAAGLLGHIDGILRGESLHEHVAGLHKYLGALAGAGTALRDSHLRGHVAAMHDNYNWDTLADNLNADAHGYQRHMYANDAEYQRALARKEDAEDDRRFLATAKGGNRSNALLDDAFGGPRDETPETYMRYVQETWGDRDHHARLNRRKGLYALVAPDGTWHAAAGMYGHGEVARSLGFANVHEALAAGYMHVATDGADHRTIHGHNPQGEYTPDQLITMKRRANEHLCYTATVHRLVDGRHVDAPVRLGRLDHVAGALGRAVAAGLGHLLGGEVTEGTATLGAGLGAAAGARLFGPGLAGAYRTIRGWLTKRRGTPMDDKTKAMLDEAERLVKMRADVEQQEPVSARSLHTLRTALRLHGHPETLANDPDTQRFWHYNVHPHVETSAAAGHGGTLKAAVARGIGLLEQHGYLPPRATPAADPAPVPLDEPDARKILDNPPPDAVVPRVKPKRKRGPRKPKKPDAPGLFDEFQ